jgi:hypothetical protein
MQQLELQWCLPLQQLREEGTAHLSEAAEQPGEACRSSGSLSSNGKHTWQGERFVLELEFDTDAAQITSLGLYLKMLGLFRGAVREVTFQLSFVAAPASNQQPGAAASSMVFGPDTETIASKSKA